MRKLFKLSFEGRVHFGESSLDSSVMTFSNDRLFSALWIESLSMGVEAEFLKQLGLSDAFPFEGDNLFLPKPIVTLRQDDSINARVKAKKAKKVQFVSADLMSSYLHGELPEPPQFGKFLVDTKVSLSRDATCDSVPFSVGHFQFFDNCGLWFIVEGDEENLAKLEPVLKSLQYSGIGGERSAGFGRFTFDVAVAEVIKCKSSNGRKLLMASAIPGDSEMNQALDGAQFLTGKCSGWLHGRDFRKKDLYKFTPGSTFLYPFDGVIVDVGDKENEALNYAKAIWMDI